MSSSKDEFKSALNLPQIIFCFFRNIGGMIIKNDLYLYVFWVDTIDVSQKINKFSTAMSIIYFAICLSGEKVDRG
jgi:hypothetical protein